MKKLFKVFIAVVLFFTVAEASAQISVGGGLWYGTDINNIGISANAKYAIDENWAAAASFTYFLKKDYVTWSTLDFNANYTFTEIENVGGLYGIGGLGFTFWGWDVDDSELGIWGDALDTNLTKIGLNLGVGLNMDISDKMAVAPEVMYTIGDFGYLRIGAKIMFGL